MSESASHKERAAALREEAAAAYLKALELNSRDSQSYFDLALLELERMEPARALAVLERADKADAGDPEIYLLTGRLAQAAGDASRARIAYERALALDARSGAAHEGLGRLDYAGGDMRGAEAHYARALELAPSVSVARTLGAIRLDAFDDRAGALSAFRLALQMAGAGPDAAALAEVVRELEALH